MSNSFYYFFSSTPQVLGSVLALFGLFIVFKIQSIRKQLLGIGKSIIADVNDIKQKIVPNNNLPYLSNASTTDSIVLEIKKSCVRSDIKGLKSIVNIIDAVDYTQYKDKYNELYRFSISLVRNTIIWSIFTTVVIIFCLGIIPFSDELVYHCQLLYSIYYIVTGSIAISFGRLLYILIKSLKETGISVFDLD